MSEYASHGVPIGKLRAFFVVSPEYDVYPQTEVDPAEPGCDVVLVCARTKQRARVLAVRAWRRGRPHSKYKGGNHMLRYDDEHPFKGLKVEDADQRIVRVWDE